MFEFLNEKCSLFQLFCKNIDTTSEAKKEDEIRQKLSLFVANKNLTEYKNFSVCKRTQLSEIELPYLKLNA